MASTVRSAFEELWQAIDSTYRRLREHENEHAQLISDELRDLGTKIDQLWSCELFEELQPVSECQTEKDASETVLQSHNDSICTSTAEDNPKPTSCGNTEQSKVAGSLGAMEEDEAEDQELSPKNTIQTLQSSLYGSDANETIPKPILDTSSRECHTDLGESSSIEVGEERNESAARASDTLELTPHTIESPEDSMILEGNYQTSTPITPAPSPRNCNDIESPEDSMILERNYETPTPITAAPFPVNCYDVQSPEDSMTPEQNSQTSTPISSAPSPVNSNDNADKDQEGNVRQQHQTDTTVHCDDEEDSHDEGPCEATGINEAEVADLSKGEFEIKDIESDRIRTLRPRPPIPSPTQALMDGQSKRKNCEQGSTRSQKRARQAATPGNLTLFKELETLPQDIIEPVDLYSKFANKHKSEDRNYLSILTRLFYAIASPEAFYQLRDACALVRQNGEFIIPQPSDTIIQTVRALDGLETAASTNAILRRYHLVRLIQHRNEREKERLAKNSNKTLKSVEVKRGFGRASSLALSDLMAEAYPELEQPSRLRDAIGTEYERRHKSIKNMLCSGRNWDLLQERFSPGILALVPVGEHGVQNYEVEKLPSPLFKVFIDILEQLRGDFLREVSDAVSARILDILQRRDLRWRYVFESIDDHALRKAHFDSADILRACELEPDT